MTARPAPTVAIITLNWNRKGDTLAFLESCAALDYPRLHTLVVDNGSADGSPAAIGAAFPQVEQILNGANLGFAAGMNAGIRRALALGADYVFLANNDTTLAPDALDRLVAAAEQQGAGMASPAIYYASAPHRVWWLGGRLRPLLLEVRRVEAPPARHDPRPFAVDFITGCGMLVRRDVLQTVGLFDERFFMYYEEVDLCRRIQQVGRRVQYWPVLKAMHIGGESAKTVAKARVSRAGSQLESWRMKSGFLYYRKHHGGLGVRGFLAIEWGWHRLRGLKAQLTGRNEAAADHATHCAQLIEAWRDTQGGRVSPPRPW